MKIIDAHIDVADLSASFDFDVQDFLDSKKDIPVSFNKLRQSNIELAVFTLYFDKSRLKTSYYDGAHECLEFYRSISESNSQIQLVKTSSELNNISSNELSYLLSIEGFECLRTPEDFSEFYEQGVRLFGFTWDYDNAYAHGRKNITKQGLTEEGKQVVKLMNENGKLLVDITHANTATVRDLDQTFNGTLVATHSNVDSICPNPHNLTDEEIQMVVNKNGVIGIFPLVDCIDSAGTFDELYKHIDYIASRWGIEYVGLSSDIYPLPEYPFLQDYKDVSVLKAVADYLNTRLEERDLNMVLYENWLRTFKKVL